MIVSQFYEIYNQFFFKVNYLQLIISAKWQEVLLISNIDNTSANSVYFGTI